MTIFVFSKEDKLLGDFNSENIDDIASKLNTWALAENIKIPRFAYAVGGEGRRWTIIETEPLKIVAGVADEVETEADVVVNSTRQNEILLKILETQEKQLFWIRFFGVITVIAMVFAFFYVILVMNSGYRRY